MKFPFPKIDLHFHLDGSMLPELAWELAKERNLKLPADNLEDFREFIVLTSDCESVYDYLERFEMPTMILQDKDALTRTAYHIIKHVAKQGLVYAEIRFAPQLHTQKGLSQKDSVEAVLEGVRKATSETPTIKIGIILCCMIAPDNINREANFETVSLAKEFYGKGVVGLDLAGPEGFVPMKEYAELFKEYRAAGYPLTIHAGDCDGPASVNEALNFKPTRIGHGHHVYDDPKVVQRVIDENITLEVCITSNIQCKTQPSYKEHPIKKLYDMGVRVTLNTDNMILSNVTLDYEYEKAMSELGFTYNDLIQMNIYAVEASFMPEEDKPKYIEQLKSYLQ
ncbi:MAG: adenosine deaminase [Erysipelotrichaceae bacterium]|nr:adenosine deaminase [Erysipelotrichaceae bacterium]MDD4642452.1 adenosine deaminase [Erysipelotrichaceae bacterium]